MSSAVIALLAALVWGKWTRDRSRLAKEHHETIRLQSALLALVRNQDSTDSTRLSEITESVSETLQVARCGIWIFNEPRTVLTGLDLYEHATKRHTSGAQLRMEHYPSYFAALEGSLVLAVSNAKVDARTSEFWESYLEPLSIGAMLDVPVRSKGGVAGVLCLEHIGSTRVWSAEEQSFAANVAHLISLYFESSERARAEKALRQSEALHRITLESISDAVFITTQQGELTFVAPNVQNVFGYSYEEMRAIGNIAKILGPNLISPERLEVEGEIVNIDREIVDRDGQRHSLLINVKAVNIGEGRLLYTCRDITARRDAEKAVGERAILAAMDADISFCLANASDLHHAMRRAVATISDHLEIISAHIWLLDEARQVLELTASSGSEAHVAEQRRVRLGMTTIGKIAANHKGRLVDSIIQSSLEEAAEWSMAARSFLGQPMVIEGRTIGVLCLFAAEPISRATFLQLENIASHIAMSVDRRRAESALRASERQYRDLVETSHDLIWSVDNQWHWTFVNNAARTIYGFEPEEMQGRRWLDFSCADAKEIDRRAFDELLAGEPIVSYETTHCRKDGTPVYLFVNAILRTDGDGQLIGATGTSTNITERKRAEAALRESEQRVQLALEGADLGLWDWNIATGAVTYNDRWASMLGYDFSDVEPTISFWKELIHPGDRRRLLRKVVAHQRSTLPLLEIELRLRTQKGTWCWVLCRGKIIERDSAGTPTRAAGTILDITEKKTAHEALQRANEELESKVAERTSELEAANERLTELDRLKSEFLATMSHELRTPLNSIIGFVGILLMGLPGPLNEEQRKQLQMVRSSATLLLGLINDLLDLSRIESGNMDVYLQECMAQDVIDEVCKSLTPLVEQKQLALHRDVPEVPVQVFTDRKRFYQILLNLLNNAVKFTEQGSICVRLGATEDFIRVAIRDTGIGIRPESMPLLFMAFRQVDGSARRNYEGSGLGLHLCRKLLDLLGGDIEVESEFGKGSCFTIWLPRQLKEARK